MEKKNFTILNATIVLTVLILFDLITKKVGFSLKEPIRLGLINFTPAKNFGLVFGTFTEFKNLVRVVFFSTLGGYAMALFFVILYFLKNKQMFLFKLSLTIFVSGIIGNVVDKTLLGFVRDFLNIGFGPMKAYAFNFADVYLMAGTFMTIFCIYAYGDELWNENSNRKTFLINKPYQLTMGLWNVSALLLVCVTLSLYSYSFLKSYIDPHLQVEDQVYKYFFFGLILIVTIYSFIFFLFTIILTHRSAGPLIAFKRYIYELKTGKGDSVKLTLREDDFHKELENLANTLKGFKLPDDLDN